MDRVRRGKEEMNLTEQKCSYCGLDSDCEIYFAWIVHKTAPEEERIVCWKCAKTMLDWVARQSGCKIFHPVIGDKK